jgi:hypothetical protein
MAIIITKTSEVRSRVFFAAQFPELRESLVFHDCVFHHDLLVRVGHRPVRRALPDAAGPLCLLESSIQERAGKGL